ncbi:MAG: hypothetical protein FJW20_14000 [Acidimicrobiia bacterium]|nr:hypothetical protein [Acidimicrobiia bacterium]
MPLHPDWKEFLELLNSQKVDYLIVGAHARGLHGIPRYTKDLDLFVRSTPENSRKLETVLQTFGFGSAGVSADDFLSPGAVIQLGFEPYRIDLLTSLSGLDFDDAWSDRVLGEMDGVPVAFLSVRAFRKNKLATGRPKDMADLDALLE